MRLLALEMPDAIPYHLNWKVSETHQAFWHLCATIDHVVPVGTDDEKAALDRDRTACHRVRFLMEIAPDGSNGVAMRLDATKEKGVSIS